MQIWRVSLIKNVLLFEAVFIAGVVLAILSTPHVWLPVSLLKIVKLLIVAGSIKLAAIFATELEEELSLNLKHVLLLVSALSVAAFANTQTIFFISVILAIEFLYAYPPLQLRNFTFAYAFRPATIFTALFLLGVYSIWGFVGAYPLLLFSTFFFAAIIWQNVFWPHQYLWTKKFKWLWIILASILFLGSLTAYIYSWHLMSSIIRNNPGGLPALVQSFSNSNLISMKGI